MLGHSRTFITLQASVGSSLAGPSEGSYSGSSPLHPLDVGRTLLNTEWGALSSEVGSHDPSDRASPLLEKTSDRGVVPLLKKVSAAATQLELDDAAAAEIENNYVTMNKLKDDRIKCLDDMLADAHECLEKAGSEGTVIKDYSEERNLKLLGSHQPQPQMAGAQERNEPSSVSVGRLSPTSLQQGRGANKIPGEELARSDRALPGSHQPRPQMGGVEERTEAEPEPEPEQELKPHQKQQQNDADADLREFLRVCGEASTRYYRQEKKSLPKS
jgi:hypothetical protein